MAHALLGWRSFRQGLSRIMADPERLAADLAAHPEVLAEAIQTVVRAEVTAGRSSIADPYALLKDLTRGKRVGQEELRAFVEGLDIGDAAKQRLLALTPATYIGAADALVDRLD
jgi:adenylosuccinate lyase